MKWRNSPEQCLVVLELKIKVVVEISLPSVLSIFAVFLTLVVNRYDSSINRRSTLLTQFNCDVNWTFVLYTPIQVIDTVRSAQYSILCPFYSTVFWHRNNLQKHCLFFISRFVSGYPLHPWLCQSYVYYRFILSSFLCNILSIDAVFHYLFLTFKSHFPLIKENLVNAIAVRVSLGMTLCFLFIRW